MLLPCVFLSATAVAAQNVHPAPGPEAQAVPLQAPIHLDGRLDEVVWSTAPAATGFRQAQPRPGDAATQRTEVRFAYDDAAIYVGARMFDDGSASGVRTRLVRRDADFGSDYLEVIFDTYHDHIGRLFFSVNPSGVRGDANGLGGGGDESWDPIWEVRTTIDSLGWTAEFRIPFSELRYPRTSEPQTWGLQIWRQQNRLNELSMWSWWSPNESGGPARFGHLSGLVVTDAPGRGAILPYTVARSTNVPVTNAADPFQDSHALDGRIGADARVLLTSNLTLNLTVNPDFGQVEVDPAVVNLSAFETSFEEKRPFFVEGAGYFGLGGLSCFFCSNTSSLSTFYSRRVGRQPQLGGAVGTVPGGRFSDLPENTTILGAAKLTGRTQSGWSIGMVDAWTARARATVEDTAGIRSHVTVEPATNYFAARFARDFAGGARVLRGMATSVVRDLENDYQSERLAAHSEMLGLATEMYFRRRTYRLMAQLAGTQVSGDAAAIARLQRSSARYFQRPDRQHGGNGLLSDAYDTTRTVLRGIGAYARMAKDQGGWLWEVSTNLRTPGFENNDIAFISRADYWWTSANVLRLLTTPTRWYRQINLIAGGQQQFNFDGDLTDRQLHLFGYIQPLNYWGISGFWIHRPSVLDDRLSRGGPVLRRVAQDFWSLSVSTDGRKSLVLNAFGDLGCNAESYCSRSGGVAAQIRPRSNISISVGPSLSHSETGVQHVQAVADPAVGADFAGVRTVFADVTQNSLSMNTRLNVTFTTNLTFELFVQPLIASARFDRFNEFAAARSSRRRVYGADIGTIQDTIYVSPENDSTLVHQIDPDGSGPAARFEVRNPDFTLRSLRGNAVLRWEYRPGSTLFFVWTRSASTTLSHDAIDFGRDVGALFEGDAHNIFLVKVNYRIGI